MVFVVVVNEIFVCLFGVLLLMLFSRSHSIESLGQGKYFKYVHDVPQVRTHGLMSCSSKMYI